MELEGTLYSKKSGSFVINIKNLSIKEKDKLKGLHKKKLHFVINQYEKTKRMAVR